MLGAFREKVARVSPSVVAAIFMIQNASVIAGSLLSVVAAEWASVVHPWAGEPGSRTEPPNVLQGARRWR